MEDQFRPSTVWRTFSCVKLLFLPRHVFVEKIGSHAPIPFASGQGVPGPVQARHGGPGAPDVKKEASGRVGDASWLGNMLHFFAYWGLVVEIQPLNC